MTSFLYSLYVTFVLSILAVGLTWAFYSDARKNVQALIDLGLTNGRLRITKSQRRQAAYRLAQLSILCVLSGMFAWILYTHPDPSSIHPIWIAVTGLQFAHIVVIVVDGWLAQRERRDIHSHTRIPTAAEAQALLGSGEVDGLMTKDPQEEDDDRGS